MGSVDVFRAAHLFTFGPRGLGNAQSVGNGLKKSAKIGECNGMLIVPTQVMLRGNVGSLDSLGCPNY